MYFCLGIKCWVSGYPGVGQGKYSCKMLWLSANSGHLGQSGGLNLWTNITLRWRICGRCKYILSHFSSSKDKGCRPLCDKVDWEVWISWSTFPLYFKSICDLILISDVRPPSQSPGGAKSISSLFSEIYNLQMAVNTPGKHTDTNIQQTQTGSQDAPVWSRDHVPFSVMSPLQRIISRGPFIMSLAILINFCNQPN